jgi:hypothetical protein
VSDQECAPSAFLLDFREMNQDQNETFPGAKWAYGLMGFFLAGMLIVALAVVLDAKNRTALETISEPTAVGDNSTLGFDPRQNPGREVLKWKGEPYFLQSNAVVQLREFEARKLSKDDSGKVQLYQVRKQSDQRIVLVKVGAGEFLPLTTR